MSRCGRKFLRGEMLDDEVADGVGAVRVAVEGEGTWGQVGPGEI